MSYLNNINLRESLSMPIYQRWHKRTSENIFFGSEKHSWEETRNKRNKRQKIRF